MFLDKLLQLADGVTTTTTAASTNVVPLTALGDAEKEAWFVFSVPTAWTETGTNTIKVEVQTSDLETFLDTDDATLVASGTISVSDLAAGYQFKSRIGVGRKKYLRGYLTVTGNSGENAVLTAAYDMNIVLDANIDRKLA